MKKNTNFWPYGILIAFVVFCGFMIGFAVFSTRNKTELVADDYYDQEIRYQRVIDGKSRMASLDEPVTIVAEPGHVRIVIPTALLAADSGHIRFYRPSDERHDFRTSWEVFRDSTAFLLPTADFVKGPYQLVMQAYRNGELYFHEQRITIE